MKTYIDVFLRSQYSNYQDFIDVIRQFSNRVSDWNFLETKSEEYSSQIGKPSCVILGLKNNCQPAVTITRRRENTFYIANIAPMTDDKLSIIEYNKIAVNFVNSFKGYARKENFKITIETTSEKVELKNIITEIKSRTIFEVYLNLFPTSYHPLDIERLDRFICSLSRHAKNSVDLELLEDWLIEEKEWSKEDASWCIHRINVGLSILKSNKNY